MKFGMRLVAALVFATAPVSAATLLISNTKSYSPPDRHRDARGEAYHSARQASNRIVFHPIAVPWSSTTRAHLGIIAVEGRAVNA